MLNTRVEICPLAINQSTMNILQICLSNKMCLDPIDPLCSEVNQTSDSLLFEGSNYKTSSPLHDIKEFQHAWRSKFGWSRVHPGFSLSFSFCFSFSLVLINIKCGGNNYLPPESCLQWRLWDVLTSSCGFRPRTEKAFSREDFCMYIFGNMLISFILNSLSVTPDNLGMDASAFQASSEALHSLI